MPGVRGPQKKKNFTQKWINFPVELAARLERYADKLRPRTTQTSIIQTALEDYLDRQEAKEK